MGWTIYNSKGEPLVTQEQHDHTAADASGPMTNDEHDGFSEYDEIAAPGAPAANKLRLYIKDFSGLSTLVYKDDDGAIHCKPVPTGDEPRVFSLLMAEPGPDEGPCHKQDRVPSRF